MAGLFADLLAFLWAVKEHWLLLVGGFVLTLVGLVFERRRGKEIHWPVYRRIVYGCLAVAAFLAWRAESGGASEQNGGRVGRAGDGSKGG